MKEYLPRNQVSDADLLNIISATVTKFLDSKQVAHSKTRHADFEDFRQDLVFHVWKLYQAGKIEIVRPSVIWKAAKFRLCDVMRSRFGKQGQKRLDVTGGNSLYKADLRDPPAAMTLDLRDSVKGLMDRCSVLDDTLRTYCELTMRGLTHLQIADAMQMNHSTLTHRVWKQKAALRSVLS